MACPYDFSRKTDPVGRAGTHGLLFMSVSRRIRTVVALKKPTAQHPWRGYPLLARGKTKMQALVATMRKLLHAIFGIFKHHQPYDGSKLFALPIPQEVITT